MNITNMDTLTIDILNEDINCLGNMLKLQIKPSQNCIVLEEYGLGNVSKKMKICCQLWNSGICKSKTWRFYYAIED